MATTIAGQLPCPDCKSEQDVKSDGRKYFINCTECRTMSTYQSKAAKTRIEKRLFPGSEPEPEPEAITPKDDTPEPETPVKPVPTPARANDSSGIFSFLNDLFDDDERKSA